jgi:hypothetical protein
MDPYDGAMSERVKRTYNLSAGTVHRVRELAAGGSIGSSQDAVVETAIERLYEQVRADEEARRWTEASTDRDFRTEMAALAREFDEAEPWPAE